MYDRPRAVALPVPGTLKASLNVTGNKLWDTLAGELNIPYERRGDFVVAIGPGELPYLDKLLAQGKQNGVRGVWLISGDEMQRREPNINPEVSGAQRPDRWARQDNF